MNNDLNSVRREVVTAGNTEVSIRETIVDAQYLWDEIMKLRTEMNEVKKLAAQEAAKPYLKKIAELEEEYAFILKLGGL